MSPPARSTLTRQKNRVRRKGFYAPMDEQRKRQLKEEYRNRKTQMGVYSFLCQETGNRYLGRDSDIPATFNGILFQLRLGSFINRALQQEWNEFGEKSFVIEVLEELDYDKDESKTDYTEDLQVLYDYYLQQYPEAKKIK